MIEPGNFTVFIEVIVIKKVLRFFLLLFPLIFLGCNDQEGLLHQYEGARLGVILTAEDIILEPSLSSTLIDYIKRRVDLQVVDAELMMEAGGSKAEQTNHFYRENLGLDYLLTVKLKNLYLKEAHPSVSLWSKHINIKINYSCSLTLSYILHDLHTNELINLGQSNGRAEESMKMGAGDHGIRIKIEEIDEFELIKAAMLDALRASGLL